MKITIHSSTPNLMMVLGILMVLLNIIPMRGHFGWPCEYDFQFHFRNGIPLGFGLLGLIANVILGIAGVLLAVVFWELALNTDGALRRRAKAKRVAEMQRVKNPAVASIRCHVCGGSVETIPVRRSVQGEWLCKMCGPGLFRS